MVMLVAGAVALCNMAVPTRGATQAQVNQAITNGVAWLVSQQNSDGSWSGSYTPVAYTGFAVTKLEERAFELGYTSPFDDAYPYKTNVINGLNYLFSQATTNGTVPGICFAPGDEDTETYGTGIAMMAIANSRAPNNVVNVTNPVVNGMTYKAVLQSVVNYFAASQNPDGGWRYYASDEPSDNSNTGFAVMGLRCAESPIYGFKCVIPATLKAGLNNWINAIQVSGSADDGGSDYTVGSGWVNLLKTGNLLFEMSFVGDNISIQRVQRAIAYIEQNWNDDNEDPGWRPHYYLGMDCLMEGFGSLNITGITVNGTNVDWFGEFADAIVASQQSNGSWPFDSFGDPMLSTEWALLVLEKVSPSVEPLQITPAVGFDAAGCVGGPFNVTNETFSLINMGTNLLNWSLANTSTWLDASPAGGTLAAGGSTNVTVCLNFNAYSLTTGFYTATVWFTNLSDNVAQSCQFTLAVGSPVITVEPTDQIVLAGSTATFSVGAIGTPLYFQWQKNGTNLFDTNNISGSATAQLFVTKTTTNDSGSYDVIITDACGSVTSSVVTLAVGVPPTIVSPPQSCIVTYGATASFGVSASGTPSLYFQWQKNGMNMTSGSVVSGLTNSTLTLGNITTNDAGSYTVIVSNLWGGVTSSAAVLFPTAPGALTPVPVTAPLWWTDTGIRLTAGAMVTIAATGSWNMSSCQLPSCWCGPDGWPSTTDSSANIFSGANNDALIAYVGDNPFQGHFGEWGFFPTNSGYWNIGSFNQFTNPYSGELWVGINSTVMFAIGYPTAGSVTAQITGEGLIATVPTLQYVPAVRGLSFWASSGTNSRSSIETTPWGYGSYMWADCGAATYSFTVGSFPTDPSATNFLVCMYIVPVGWATETNPDFVEPNCILMQLGVTNGFANWIFRWKTNAPDGDGQLYATNAQILLTNPTPQGRWTLTFSNYTSVTMTAPGGNSTNFVMGVHPNVPDIRSAFTDPGIVYLGVAAAGINTNDLSAIITAAQIYDGDWCLTTISNNWLVETNLDPAQWVPVANAACCLVPTNNACWLNWTLPDWGYALQTNSNLTLPGGWSTNGLLPGTMLGDKSRLLIKPGDLPDSPQLFFRLSKPGY